METEWRKNKGKLGDGDDGSNNWKVNTTFELREKNSLTLHDSDILLVFPSFFLLISLPLLEMVLVEKTRLKYQSLGLTVNKLLIF